MLETSFNLGPGIAEDAVEVKPAWTGLQLCILIGIAMRLTQFLLNYFN
jgi:hypothetical protein